MTNPPRILAVLPHVIPSTVLTVLKPLTALDRAGRIRVELELEYLVSRRQVERADLVVFSRNTDPAYRRALNAAVELGKPIVYDLDDNFFEMPRYARVEQHYGRPDWLAQFDGYLRSAHLVRVYSECLRRRIAAVNPNTVRVAGPLDWSLVPAETRRAAGQVSIVYATGRLGDELANVFLADIERVLVAFPDHVKLFLWGYRSPGLAGHPSVRFLNRIADYDRFFFKFARSNFDIGLAPLLSDEFHLSKSNNKFREYAACGIAGVYSDVEVYADCVEHGVTGLRVPNERGAWFEAVTRLIKDESLRGSIQASAQRYARAHYGQEQFAAVWLEQIQTLLARIEPDFQNLQDFGSLCYCTSA